jgi:pre-mRNA-splicing factor CWC22
VPPHRLKHLALPPTSKEDAQKVAWDGLKKRINSLINKVNTSNLQTIVLQLFNENLIRGRGILARSIIKAQLASPLFTPLYASLAAILNSKLPSTVDLLLKRFILQFQRSFTRNNKVVTTATIKMIGQLLNYRVLKEEVGFQMLAILLANGESDAVGLACVLAKEAGKFLTSVSPASMNTVFN